MPAAPLPRSEILFLLLPADFCTVYHVLLLPSTIIALPASCRLLYDPVPPLPAARWPAHVTRASSWLRHHVLCRPDSNPSRLHAGICFTSEPSWLGFSAHPLKFRSSYKPSRSLSAAGWLQWPMCVGYTPLVWGPGQVLMRSYVIAPTPYLPVFPPFPRDCTWFKLPSQFFFPA